MQSKPERFRFGGLTIPNTADPAPGPLAQLAARFAAEARRCWTPSRAVQRMLAALPPQLSTRALQDHPDILERLAAVWDQPRAVRETFDELMFLPRSRGARLSYQAVEELTELKEHVLRVRLGFRTSVWDEVLGLG